MDIMNLLSEEDIEKLIEYAKKLKDLSNREEKLMKKAKELIEKGSKVDKNKTNLIDRSKNVINLENGVIKANINSSLESEEFINLVTKSNDYKIEEEKINNEASIINKELDEISDLRLSLKNKIDAVLSAATKKNIGINVDNIGNVYIIDAPIPDNFDKISSDLCEIINCNISLIKEISEIFNSNVTNTILENYIDEFKKLKSYTSKYEFNKDDIYDKQLELLNKTIGEKVEIDTEKIIIPNEEKSVDKIQEVVVPKSEIEVNIPSEPTVEKVIEDDKKIDNIVPLSDVINMDVDINNNKLNESVLYILKDDKVVPNQIARATKDKLYNKIMLIFDGSYPKTVIEYVDNVNEKNTNDSFNIENFVSSKVA